MNEFDNEDEKNKTTKYNENNDQTNFKNIEYDDSQSKTRNEALTYHRNDEHCVDHNYNDNDKNLNEYNKNLENDESKTFNLNNFNNNNNIEDNFNNTENNNQDNEIKDIQDDQNNHNTTDIPHIDHQSKRWRIFINIIKIAFVSLLIAVIIAVVVIMAIPNSPGRQTMSSFLSWVQDIPTLLGMAILGGVYALGLVFFCPGTPFNLAAGFLFQLYLGTSVALVGAFFGSSIAFILGRTLLRGWASGLAARRPIFHALDRALEGKALKLVFLSRLSPLMPFPLLNYFFGATNVGIIPYSVGTLLGLVPFTAVYCYIGTFLSNLAEIWDQGITSGEGTKQIILLSVTMVITVVVLVLVSFITTKALRKSLREAQEDKELEQEQSVDTESHSPDNLEEDHSTVSTKLGFKISGNGKEDDDSTGERTPLTSSLPNSNSSISHYAT